MLKMQKLAAHDTYWENFFRNSLGLQEKKGLLRSLSAVETPISPRIRIGGKEYLHFSSNDYLGLANDPRMKEVSIDSARYWGTSAGASPLISGRSSLCSELEEELAYFKKTESAIVFTSGYSANTGVISSLTDSGDLILSDSLNHASIVDGCRLARARVKVYPHQDLGCLEDLLKKEAVKGKILVASDSVFSMDGDTADVPAIYNLCSEHGALLYLDDAHGTGVMGKTGRGILEHFGLEGSGGVVQMGTFSKALGSLGGFAAGSRLLSDFLVNRARSFIFSTGLPPSVIAANKESLKIVRNDPKPRQKLNRLGSYLREGFERAGFPLEGNVNHIFSFIIGCSADAVEAYKHLLENGIYLPAIRPPTVAVNRSRLRISLSALHSQQDIDFLLDALKRFFVKGA